MTIEEAKKLGFHQYIYGPVDYVFVWYKNGMAENVNVANLDTSKMFPTRKAMREERKRLARLAEYRKSVWPITPERAKDLRDGDIWYYRDAYLDGIASCSSLTAKYADQSFGRYWSREADEAALAKQKSQCDMPEELTIDGRLCKRVPDGQPHASGDIPVDGSQTHRLGSVWYRPVESHETPVGETQDEEVVTDETQPKPSCDAVSHPSHYTSHPSGVECITITKHMNFCRGNAVKYLWRAGQKGDSIEKEIEDIAKAEEYCRIEKERLIALKGAK